MKINLAVLSLLGFTSLAFSGTAADRVHAGQWVGTTTVGGTTYPTSSCLSQSDADAINGDAKAVAAYLKTIIPAEICTISDVKVDGKQIVYAAACRGGTKTTSKVVTTAYYGDRSEGTDSTGGKTQAKLTGACTAK